MEAIRENTAPDNLKNVFKEALREDREEQDASKRKVKGVNNG